MRVRQSDLRMNYINLPDFLAMDHMPSWANVLPQFAVLQWFPPTVRENFKTKAFAHNLPGADLGPGNSPCLPSPLTLSWPANLFLFCSPSVLLLPVFH